MPHKDPEARKAYRKAYREKNAEKLKQLSRDWMRNNKERRREYYKERMAAMGDVLRERGREERSRRKPKIQEYHLKRLYGLTLAERDALLVSQDNKCAVCLRGVEINVTQRRNTANVDHCHATGIVRGILCSNCNRAVGLLEDSPERFRAAAEYLEKARKK